MKLTRKQVKEGLEQVPLDVVLLGAAGAKEQKLTPKQREFARQIALGETKAGAYRKSRNSKAKPETQSKRGQELAKIGAVQAQIEAFKLAIEAGKSATPAHIRALTIQQLTQHALDESFPPAQRVKALELLGKITEVALFTERREVVQVTNSHEIRERLINSLRLAMQANSIDAETAQADDLMAEIQSAGNLDQAAAGAGEAIQADPAAGEIQIAGDPPPADPLKISENQAAPLLSNLHTQSPQNSASSEVTPDPSNVTITPVTVTIPNEIKDLPSNAAVTIGGVGAKVTGGFQDSNPGNTPLSDLVPSGNWK